MTRAPSEMLVVQWVSIPCPYIMQVPFFLYPHSTNGERPLPKYIHIAAMPFFLRVASVGAPMVVYAGYWGHDSTTIELEPSFFRTTIKNKVSTAPRILRGDRIRLSHQSDTIIDHPVDLEFKRLDGFSHIFLASVPTVRSSLELEWWVS